MVLVVAKNRTVWVTEQSRLSKKATLGHLRKLAVSMSDSWVTFHITRVENLEKLVVSVSESYMLRVDCLSLSST